MFVFVVLGQATGNEMALHPPIQAYIVNIIASLLGVWGFTLISYWQTGTVIWIGLALIGMTAYFSYRKVLNRLTVGIFILVILAVYFFGRQNMWSPYSRLSLTSIYTAASDNAPQVQLGYQLEVQQVFYQTAVDFRPKRLRS